MDIKNGLPVFDFDSLENVDEKKTEAQVYNCPKHGYFRDPRKFNFAEAEKYCPECAHEREIERQRVAEERMHIELCKECNVEKEFYFKTLDDYIPHIPAQQTAKAAVERMINVRHGKIFLIGDNGSGKSMLGSIAAKDLGGKIYSMYEISTMIRQSYTIKAEKTELEIVKELASIPFLAIDELGRTKGSEAELNWLSYVLDKRHTRDLPFMIMTNGHFNSDCPHGQKGCSQCIENFLGNDILSRLQEKSVIINLKGAPDMRRS